VEVELDVLIFSTFQIVLLIHRKTCGHMEIIIDLMRMEGAWHMQPMIVGGMHIQLKQLVFCLKSEHYSGQHAC
jgi:hypothetical protein